MKILFPALAAAVIAASAPAQAQSQSSAADFPNKPITIVVPYPPGGTSDNQVRMIAEPLSQILGQPVIVENRSGASGALGASAVARAAPDGYTLLYPNNGLLIAPILNKQAGYDPLGFAPVSMVTKVPLVLVVNKEVPASNLREFIDYAKARSGQLNYAAAGPASYGNLSTQLLSRRAGIEMTLIPYRGEANTTMAVRTGETQVLLTTPSSAMLGQVKEGHLKLLGVGSLKRSELLPDVQPIAEVLPGFSAEVWFGLLAPAGTPPAVIGKLNAAVRQVLGDTKIRARMFVTGAIVEPSTPQAFQELMRNEHARLAEVVQAGGIKAD